MADVYSDLASLKKQHPEWSNDKLTAELQAKYSGKVSPQQLQSIVAGAVRVTSEKAASEKKKADLEKYQGAQELTADIISRALSSDPTAVKATTMTGMVNPLTNKPMQGSSTAASGIEYTLVDPSQFGPGQRFQSMQDPSTGGNAVYYVEYVGGVPVKRQVILIGDPNNPRQLAWMDIEQAGSYFLRQFSAKTPEQSALNLKNFLLSKGAYGTPAAAKKAFAQKGIIDTGTQKAYNTYLKNLSLTNFMNYQVGFMPFGSQIGGTPGGSYAGTTTSIVEDRTPKDIAAQEITKFISSYLGRGASAKEINDYTKALNQYEADHPDKTVTTTNALGTVKKTVRYAGATAEDKNAMLVGMLAKQLQAAGVDPNKISADGGLIGVNMQKLIKVANDYGIHNYDNTKALNAVISAVKTGGDINAEINKMKALAKEYYKPLASYIDAGGNVADIADNYATIKRKYLETMDPTNVFDQDVQRGILGDGKSMMSQNDYIGFIKSKPEWSKTVNAREQAAEFADTILKNFGLVG